MRTYRARIDKPGEDIYAVEVYLTAPSIIAAGETVLLMFGALGVDHANVTKLIEVENGSHAS